MALFRLPTIARACKQIRSESLAVFFDINAFHIRTIAPFVGQPIHTNGVLTQRGLYLDPDNPRRSRTGVLHLPRQVSPFLSSPEGKAIARFRNLELVIQQLDGEPRLKELRIPRYAPWTTLSLQSTLTESISSPSPGQPPVFTCTYETGLTPWRCHTTDVAYDEDMDYLSAPAKAIIKEKLAEPVFRDSRPMSCGGWWSLCAGRHQQTPHRRRLGVPDSGCGPCEVL